MNFYPRSPCGERQVPLAESTSESEDFYPRSPCGERQSCHPLIHHPLEFLSTLSLRRATVGFGWNNNAGSVFLSTLSLRRATLNRPTPLTSRAISIHALLAESDTANTGATKSGQISIHALLAESDGKIPVNIMLHFDFYPRSPCGERLLPPTRRLGNVLFLSTLSLRRATVPYQYLS